MGVTADLIFAVSSHSSTLPVTAVIPHILSPLPR